MSGFAPLGRHGEAAEAAREGLSVIAPFAEAVPDAFGPLAMALAQIYLEQCKTAGLAPDEALLMRIVKALGLDKDDSAE